MYKTKFQIGPIHLINPELRVKNYELRVKIRHGAAMHDCVVEGDHVKLKSPVHGVAAGQFAVFYAPNPDGEGEICLGSGGIG